MMHSKLAPSRAARRMLCSGSRALEERYPRESSESAKEGELAHWYASRYLLEQAYSVNDIRLSEITDEMKEAAETYAGVICADLTRCKLMISALNVEQTIDIKSIHPECFGTPDAWFYHKKENGLYIYDFKYGHKPVDAFENWQLIAYSNGILDIIRGYNAGVDFDELKVIFRIVQPRCYNGTSTVKSWSISCPELYFYFDKLRLSEQAAMQDNAPCTPNPLCATCNAKHACEALQRSALQAVDESQVTTARELNAAELSAELRLLKRAQERLEARILGLEEEAFAMLKRGERLPYFRLDEIKSRARWKQDKLPELEILADLMRVNVKKPAEFMTPRQVIKSGLPAEIVNQFVDSSTNGKLKLTYEESAKSIFRKK